MSAAPQVAGAVMAPGAVARPPEALDRQSPPALARRLAGRLANEWLPRAAWTIGRTGRPGLFGIALLLASALFLVSTHLEVAAEVEAMRADLATAQARGRTAAPDRVAGTTTSMPPLPARSEMPAILGQLFDKAARARLAVDTAKYEISAVRGSGVFQYRIAFPVTGPYPQIRSFIDATLAAMPAVALTDLVLERKSIGRGNVEAELRMTVYTRSAP